MNRTVLDTEQLITFWNRQRDATGERTPTPDAAEAWGRLHARRTGTKAILSPTYLEFVGGARSGEELKAFRAFLATFEVVDGWEIRPIDLEGARRRAERVPPNRKRRGAVDCLIRAVASRLGYAVRTRDRGFPT